MYDQQHSSRLLRRAGLCLLTRSCLQSRTCLLFAGLVFASCVSVYVFAAFLAVLLSRFAAHVCGQEAATTF
jgi:hypothetical protein